MINGFLNRGKYNKYQNNRPLFKTTLFNRFTTLRGSVSNALTVNIKTGNKFYHYCLYFGKKNLKPERHIKTTLAGIYLEGLQIVF